MRGATAKSLSGTYRLTPWLSARRRYISVAAGTSLSGGTYTLTLSNPALHIVDTFAGDGLDLLLTGGIGNRIVKFVGLGLMGRIARAQLTMS